MEIGRSVEIDLGVARALWFRMPATTEVPHDSVSRADGVGVSFTGHRRAVVERASGRRDEIAVAPNASFVTGGEAYSWVRVPEPYEGVEIVLDPSILSEVALDHRAPMAGELAHRVLDPDPVFWAAAVRVREHAIGGRPLGDVEGDALARTLFAHVICEHFGGCPPRRNMRPLDTRRLLRVADHVAARLGDKLSVSDLASVASMSPHHFHTAFRRATGLTPHEFVTARRMERARVLLAKGVSRGETARRVGYTAGHAFRRALKRFGA